MTEFSHIRGEVVAGKGEGRTFGFPTLNIIMNSDDAKTYCGVYAGHVLVNTASYRAAIAILDTPPQCEAFLLDLDKGSYYGKTVEVTLFEKVSDIKKYESREALIKKIENDVAKVREYFLRIEN
ncbi:MAG TPA: hypothetical protein DCY48_04105 [Candidatus Magasanikbacteria bacterium]|nr:MAG: hypothetical protein A3I74_00340 [Candidatus Magasanikbacteria bacterium RIFCSPLOWO2_02_FULL_47_16]OGH80100.1 MAG: hypothetical protein A3C10_02890 [Candidatus Magasanikbacteria bacterium RIFCSPHIGHO2_02_FULL_48_18]OGH83315.1 MAG: hypothetical protein A3G08_00210 [Candidatus Magasanikbacteria bacterium RIFCSPLOWO2_12_FULL_47_9b]HAZ28928.1 hypothetical protein [Candidatus Magasanikbacteria bacterium]